MNITFDKLPSYPLHDFMICIPDREGNLQYWGTCDYREEADSCFEELLNEAVVIELDEEDKKELGVIHAKEAHRRWIRVTERLPEYGDVLVTIRPRFGLGIANTRVIIANYSAPGGKEPCFHIGEFGKDDFKDLSRFVLAWMPLPRPYVLEI